MGDKIIEIQHQIRNNANSLRDYIDELANWEEEVNQIDSKLANKTFPLIEPPPVRGVVKSEEVEKEGKEGKDSQGLYKRDKNNMKDYYKAWDSYDIDKELEKLEDKPKIFQPPKVPAKPKANIIVKGGRAVNSEVDRLKDAGNLEFSSGNYEKALEKYSACLDLEVPKDVQIVLLSNSAECWLRLREFQKALESASAALLVDEKHVKSLLRSAKAKKGLNMFKSAKVDLQFALSVDEKNQVLSQELAKLESKVKSLNDEVINKMVSRGKVPATGLRSVEVLETGKDEEKTEKPLKEQEKTIKEQTEKALGSVSIEMLPLPKNLVELERNWNMLTDANKLSTYLQSIPSDLLKSLFEKGNLESDFLMKVINSVLTNFLDLQTHAFPLIEALTSNKKFGVVSKFLTKKEKEKIKELLSLLGNPSIPVLNGIIY
jgi:tetratricopeptide (TPR) repeat protein